MRRFLFLTMMCVLGLFGTLRAQEVIVGTNDGETTYNYIPLRARYQYSATQQIYKAADLNKSEGGSVSAVSFMVSENSQLASFTRNIKIYMQNSSKSAFTTTQYVAMTSADKYFEGEVTFDKKGEWITIQLDKPFEYNGTDNILLGVASSNSSTITMDIPFVVWKSSTRDALYKNSNTTEYDLENMPSYTL